MYTDEELEAAVLQYLTSEVALVRSEQGTRDIDAVKTQVYELVSSAFMLRPDALFSVCWLATNKLRAQVALQLGDMQAILDAAPRVSSSSVRVQSTTDLRNAEASLLTLTAAFAARSSGVAGSIGPAIARFSASIGSFIQSELVKNTVSGGDVVSTPEELRTLISTHWAAARERHGTIAKMVARVIGALADYNSVRLPASVVASMLARIQARLAEVTLQMESATAAAQSRQAMLELAAMRVLLKQAAQFHAPVLRRSPLTGDAVSGLLQGSTGVPASIQGAVSGPFNYAPGTTLAYSVGGTSALGLLPSSSAASLRSQALSPWVDPPPGAECAVFVDGVVIATAAAAAWGAGSVAAAALDTALLGVAVYWEGAYSVLRFESEQADDRSQLVFLSDTTPRADFVTWLLGDGLPRSADGAPVEASEVVEALAQDPRLKATVLTDAVADFRGQRSTTLGEEAVLWHHVVSGEELVLDGSAVVHAGVDLEALGVASGMAFVVTDPVSLVRRVLSVEGPLVLLDAALPVTAEASYFIGPDYTGTVAGARAQVSGTVDAGAYRVLLGAPGQLLLDRPLTVVGAVQVGLSRVRLEVALRDIGPSLTLTILPSSGATALGLAPQTARPLLDTFDTGVDLAARGVRAGDLLELGHTASAPTLHTCTSLSGTRLTVAPPVPYEGGALPYEIRDPLVSSYNDLRASLLYAASVEVFTNEAALDQAVGRLARGARFTGSLVETLTGYVAALLELFDLCDQYVVPRDPTVEQALRLMAEQGFDRAADLFTALSLREFFALDAEGVSYKTWVLRAAATAGRLAVPVSKASADPTSNLQVDAVQSAPGGR